MKAKQIHLAAVFFSVATLSATSQSATAEIIATGYSVQVYASVADPVNLAFDPAGNAYVGRDNVGSGGGSSDAVRIHRIGVGGTPVTEYGDSPIFDPDSVTFDVSGTISGTPGSVLVGGGTGSNSMDRLTAILPDQTTSILFTSAPGVFSDINQLAFDSAGRLLIRDDFNVYGMTSSSLASRTTLVSFGPVRPTGLAVGSNDEFYVGVNDGTIRRYAANGTPIDLSVATGLNTPAVLYAQSTLFPDGLYALDQGTLFRVDGFGVTEIASGFDPNSYSSFGPDGALYVSEFSGDRVLRVAPVPEPASIALFAIGIGVVSSRRFWFRRRTPSANRSANRLPIAGGECFHEHR